MSIGGPVGEPTPTYAETVVVNVRGGNTADVRDMLAAQADVLGIDEQEVQQWAKRFPTPDRRGDLA